MAAEPLERAPSYADNTSQRAVKPHVQVQSSSPAAVTVQREEMAESGKTFTNWAQKRKSARLANEQAQERKQAIATAIAEETKWKAERRRVKREAQEAAQCKFAVDSQIKTVGTQFSLNLKRVQWQMGLAQEFSRRLEAERLAVKREAETWRLLEEESKTLEEQLAAFAALDKAKALEKSANEAAHRRLGGRIASNATKAVVLFLRSKRRGKFWVYKVPVTKALGFMKSEAMTHWNISMPLARVHLSFQGRLVKGKETAGDLGLADEDVIDLEEDVVHLNATKLAADPPKKAGVAQLGALRAKALSRPQLASRSSLWTKGGAARSWDAAIAKATEVAERLTPQEITSLLRGSHSGEPGWYAGNTEPVPRLGVPPLRMQPDAYRFRPFRAGAHRTVTCWPSPLALAATWDEVLVGQVAKAIGEELRRKGVNVLLGPAVNVQRLPHHGRSFESLAGEDPHLGARLVRPFVHGVQSEKVIACAKHFAFNDQERYKPRVSYEPSEKVAWELYYPPFEAAVEAGVGAVMCSDAKVNGTASCENEHLLKRDLKGAMNFSGFVLSEWDTMSTSPRPGQTRSDGLPSLGQTQSDASRASGLDVDMPGTTGSEKAEVAIQQSADSLKRVLTTMYRIGVDKFKGWTPREGLTLQDSNQRTGTNEALAAKAAARSAVLLKNNGILPLLPSSHQRTLAILGPAAGAPPKNTLWGADYYSGGGSGHVPASNGAAATPVERIGRRAYYANMSVVTYSGSHVELAKQRAMSADIVVVVAGATASEGEDRASLSLDNGADALISAVALLRPTVVLLQVPGAVLTPWRGKVSAIASLFLAGEGTGAAWAQVLFGDTSPAGKLPVMFPSSESDVIRRTQNQAVSFSEGLFTSYRSPALKAAFSFGHGLSYARFSYGRQQIATEGCPARLCISVTIRNEGDFPGSEVAQAYLSFPNDAGSPRSVLRGFEKTSVLQPGQEETVTFALSRRDLSTYDTGRGWVVQPELRVRIGSSSTDIRREFPVRLSPEEAAGDVAM